MSRKEKIVTITDEGRDRNKSFQLREMGALKAEKWGLKVLSAAARAGVDIGDVPAGNMQALVVIGLQAAFKAPFADVEPLLDELFECVKIIRDPRYPDMVMSLIEDDIEEVATRLKLRWEVLQLHVGFSQGAEASRSTSETAPKSEDSSSTSTSRQSSAPRSRLTRRR